MVLSIGIFFSLIITGLTHTLPEALSSGLTAQGVPADNANQIAGLPAVSVLFAALLGYNPVQSLLGPAVLSHLPAGNAAYLTGRGFFPQLISGPFAHGLAIAFGFAIAACLIAALASALRGGKYVHDDSEPAPVERARPDRPVRVPQSSFEGRAEGGSHEITGLG